MKKPDQTRPDAGHEEVVFKAPWHTVRKARFQRGGKEVTLFISDYGARACVVVEGPSGILLTRQHRYLIDWLSWEIPGGQVDRQESPEQGARRECLEETGVRCKTLSQLLVFHPGLDTLLNPTYVFGCRNFEQIELSAAHPDEVDAIEWVDLQECLNMIREGRIVDSLSIIALLYYARFALRT